jgi:Putative auto-transporter adhesin, head GIN domain
MQLCSVYEIFRDAFTMKRNQKTYFFIKFFILSMQKAIVFILALLAAPFFVVAQDTKTKDKSDKKESTTASWNDWSGGERVRGTGPVVTESREVGDFRGMSSGISADIVLRQGSKHAVKIEGQKNILDLMTTEVKDGILKISFKKGYSIGWNNEKPLKIYLEAPSFEVLGMSGSGNVVAENDLSGKSLDIRISGSGDFNLKNVRYDALNVGVSGSGDIKLGGSAESIDVGISGSGDLNAANLKTKRAKCRISGSGDITVNATNELDASISGSGDINYYGKPATVKTKVSGSGDIEAK